MAAGVSWSRSPLHREEPVCASVSPDAFTATVWAFNRPLFEVGPFDSYDAAARAAREELEERFASLFATST